MNNTCNIFTSPAVSLLAADCGTGKCTIPADDGDFIAAFDGISVSPSGVGGNGFKIGVGCPAGDDAGPTRVRLGSI